MNPDNRDEMIIDICRTNERHIYYIAMTIITLFGVSIIICFPIYGNIPQGILTGFLAWIGSIVGFYFGQKPVSDVLNRLQENEREMRRKIEKADDISEKYHRASALLKEMAHLAKEQKGQI